MVTSKEYDDILSDDHKGILDYGLSVIYDEKQNEVIDAKKPKTYPIGGMISEFTNLNAPKIKDVIMACSNLSEPATVENSVTALMEIYDKMFDEFEPVQAIMTATEFLYTFQDWFEACRTNRVDDFLNMVKKTSNSDNINKYIFESTNYTEPGGETVEQLLCTAYLCFSSTYTLVTYAFYQIIQLEGHYTEEGGSAAIELIETMLSDQPDLQHIDFRIMAIDGNFSPMYTIKSALSLLLFETIHCVEKNVDFTKCANCGKVFVPEGRKDIKYCSYPSPQKKEKSCREIGAQIARQNKEKNDVFTHEYRRVYSRLKMAKKRHPGNLKYTTALENFAQEANEWKTNLRNGLTTMEQFTKWIENY